MYVQLCEQIQNIEFRIQSMMHRFAFLPMRIQQQQPEHKLSHARTTSLIFILTGTKTCAERNMHVQSKQQVAVVFGRLKRPWAPVEMSRCLMPVPTAQRSCRIPRLSKQGGAATGALIEIHKHFSRRPPTFPSP